MSFEVERPLLPRSVCTDSEHASSLLIKIYIETKRPFLTIFLVDPSAIHELNVKLLAVVCVLLVKLDSHPRIPPSSVGVIPPS